MSDAYTTRRNQKVDPGFTSNQEMESIFASTQETLTERVAGYRYALTCPQWRVITQAEAEAAFASAFYGTLDAYYAHVAEHGTPRAYWSFCVGMNDAKRLLADRRIILGRRIVNDDDQEDNTILSAPEIAEAAGYNVSYIKAEIAAGRLPAFKEGSQWRIYASDYMRWITPKRT